MGHAGFLVEDIKIIKMERPFLNSLSWGDANPLQDAGRSNSGSPV